ncbi:hypothetical protein HBI56_031770 [Parastagonospora nodorum]|uniref:CBF1-interacting co-repressor CIR N-terminal domain-containing protein n=1 Tax=Phaeosphaeria nodorum (strain SN15 / ATCC MYA-4574 / FGSC 10173) TaxID=321614 RepID=A0A7U2EYF2_PHANO|nr:hypothetical protein HBH56_019480 [Parastagonospora nodorum]QRC95349.1 hypothetical protein JI435_030460 [Parastagonospora nodorum SN15]KAH3936803.1 hypothetical protein HBH54_015010 [Parastagonospora nodorum]KAH4034792.1 hypothetical protein HBI09_103280 [Parastagonospora nodorum]KAH4074718.1 hypothetical protein HBH50_028940 [Parastagonospora nodorum]
MPLHLLGHKSWHVYNSANIARVKADEEAAAAREAADEQRMQELDAARRAAILRGQTPPPLPDEAEKKDHPERKRERDDRGHTRKRRKLAGEDDTDMDIRLAASITAPKEDDDEKNAKVLKLRNTKLDAPLTDHAGHIDLFPIDTKEANKREKNAEVEKEKRRKERAFEDQYTMRFSNAAGREGLDKPWYAAQQKHDAEDSTALDYPHLENKNVWGNEDPRRKEREHARITSNDPFAFMQQAQSQLKKAKQDKKKWAAERERELRELRAAQEREDRRERHHKRKRRDEDHVEVLRSDKAGRDVDRDRSAKHRRHRSRSRSRDGSSHRSSKRRRSRSRDRERHRHTSSRQARHEDDQRTH